MFFQRHAVSLFPGPWVSFSKAEMLLSDEGRFFEMWLWVGLRVVDGLSGPEGSLEWRGIDSREAGGGQALRESLSLL